MANPISRLALLLPLVLLDGCLLPYDPAYDYLAALKDSPAWDQGCDPSFAPFGYQASTAAELVALDLKWGTTATAGQGTTFQRMLRLMGWVNDVTTQDGSIAPSPLPDAFHQRFRSFPELPGDGHHPGRGPPGCGHRRANTDHVSGAALARLPCCGDRVEPGACQMDRVRLFLDDGHVETEE